MSKSDPQSLSVRAIIAFYREFERVMRDGDISLAQYRTMLYLKGGAKRAGAIAAAGAVKKPTVSAMLNNLREKGWIRDEADPVDGRAIAVALTPAGAPASRRLKSRFPTIWPRSSPSPTSRRSAARLPAPISTLPPHRTNG